MGARDPTMSPWGWIREGLTSVSAYLFPCADPRGLQILTESSKLFPETVVLQRPKIDAFEGSH
jgi:hypothetical protein